MPSDRVADQLKQLVDGALKCESQASLLGVEGTAARIFFSAFSTMLKREVGIFEMQARNRRPPRDQINAMLSYSYALLVKDLTATVLAVGLDPYVGIYHKPRFGRPALALDLAEEFRPLIAESAVLHAINNQAVTPRDFTHRAGAVNLTRTGRSKMIGAYERRLGHEITHPLFGYRITYRRVLEVQARLLAAYILGEVDEYKGFRTR